MGGAHSCDVLGWDIDLSGDHQDAPYFDIGGVSPIDVGRIGCAHHAAGWVVAAPRFDCGDLST